MYGVPFHAWCPQIFRKIGNHIGKVVEVDKFTSSKGDLRKGRIQVETPIFSSICRSVNYQIWNKQYEIHGIEEAASYTTEERGVLRQKLEIHQNRNKR